MKPNLLLITAICCTLIVMGLVAFQVGPPRSNAVETSHTPPMQAGAAVRPGVAREMPVGLVGSNVSSFGPVPSCGDQVAMGTVLGLLRKSAYERLLGLANVHVTEQSQVGRPVRLECEADIEGGKGLQHVRYSINQEATGQESWQITVLKPADEATLLIPVSDK